MADPKTRAERLDAACSRIDAMCVRADAFSFPAGLPNDLKQAYEKAHAENKRTHKAFLQKDTAANRAAWDASIRAMDRANAAIDKWEKSRKDAAPPSRRDRIASILGRCDQVMKRADAMEVRKDADPSSLKEGQVVMVRGKRVRIIGLDSDPRANVHGVLANDPDKLVEFKRSEVQGGDSRKDAESHNPNRIAELASRLAGVDWESDHRLNGVHFDRAREMIKKYPNLSEQELARKVKNGG